MKFKTTITSRSIDEPIEAVVTAVDPMFSAANPLPGQDPSGQKFAVQQHVTMEAA